MRKTLAYLCVLGLLAFSGHVLFSWGRIHQREHDVSCLQTDASWSAVVVCMDSQP